WNMLRALDFQNELYDRSDGRDPITHPATQKEAELYSRYYIRVEGSFNRAYKQLKDSQTNRICQLIEVNPDAPRPSLPLADALKIQRFAKRTPPPRTNPETEPRPSASAAPSDDILTHFPPSVAAEIRDDAANLDISINFLISQYAKIGYQTALEQSVRNEPNYDCVKR
ncbi:MAG: hypothetical protein IT168_25500, partial [Bryobacterales bacterium]|nr:hypothetical protein [Bryobacterales bacterium]